MNVEETSNTYSFSSITEDSEHVPLTFCNLFGVLCCWRVLLTSWGPQLLQPIPTLQFEFNHESYPEYDWINKSLVNHSGCSAIYIIAF